MSIFRFVLFFTIQFFIVYSFNASNDVPDTNKKRCDGLITIIPPTTSLEVCAQPSDNSKSKNPTIKVNLDFSYFLGISFGYPDSESQDLAHGDCYFRYAFPNFLRYCARIAKPAQTDNSDPKNPKTFDADPGYTDGYHINSNSRWVKDDVLKYEQYIKSDASETAYQKCSNLLKDPSIIPNPIACSSCPNSISSGSCTVTFDMKTSQPKICLYRDPWVLDVFDIKGPDLWDWWPHYQPIHVGSKELSIVGELLKTILKIGTSGVGLLSGLLGKIFSLGFLDNIVQYILDFINMFGDKIIEYLFQLNRVADPLADGACVNIPLGPNPPPYCKTIADCNNKSIPYATLEQICPTLATNLIKDNDGLITQQDLVTRVIDGDNIQTFKNDNTIVNKKDLKSTMANCVPPLDLPLDLNNNPDQVRNNVINNAVRVSYSSQIPACVYDTDSNSNEDHIKDNKRFSAGMCARFNVGKANVTEDLIPPCSPNSINNSQCVNISPIYKYSKNTFYKAIYKIDAVSTTNPNTKQTNSFSKTKTLIGIDIGDFKDVSINYAKNETSKSFSLTDIVGDAHKYQIKSYGTNDKPSNSICLYKNSKLISCVTRAQPPQPQIYDCKLAPKLGVQNCSNTFQNPSAIFGIKIGKDEIYKVVDKKSMKNLDIAGISIYSFISDDNFIYPPFNVQDKKHVMTTKDNARMTIVGDYDPDLPSADFITDNISNMPKISNHDYLMGLEYYKGDYKYGGKYLCIDNSNYTKCPMNAQDCVLTKTQDSLCTNSTSSENRCIASSDPKDRVWPTYKNSSNIKDQILENGQCYVPKSIQTIITSLSTPSGASMPDFNMNPCDSGQPVIDESSDSTKIVRNKNSLEQGLCIEIPQPDPCPGTQTMSIFLPPNSDDGFAVWPKTDYGHLAEGKCAVQFGYIPSPLGNPSRYCLVDTNNGKTSFGKVKNPCIKIPIKK